MVFLCLAERTSLILVIVIVVRGLSVIYNVISFHTKCPQADFRSLSLSLSLSFTPSSLSSSFVIGNDDGVMLVVSTWTKV